jgi:hypothetical protein
MATILESAPDRDAARNSATLTSVAWLFSPTCSASHSRRCRMKRAVRMQESLK